MPNCEICGEPMPPGEDMFKFHGYSGPCPKPPLPAPANPNEELARQITHALINAFAVKHHDFTVACRLIQQHLDKARS